MHVVSWSVPAAKKCLVVIDPSQRVVAGGDPTMTTVSYQLTGLAVSLLSLLVSSELQEGGDLRI
jgi:hypothetical protein